MTSAELLTLVEAEFGHRRFSAGLLIAFIDFIEALGVPAMHLSGTADFFAAFPQQTVFKGGKQVNTLIVQRATGTLSIRSFYNAAEKMFREEHHRYDYPSCAPHATQAWRDYLPWLDALVMSDSITLGHLKQSVTDFVLKQLPDQAFDPAQARREPPLFRYILESFDVTPQEGEKTGSAFQGIVYGFLKADNPHLQSDTRKVRVGSARQGGIGDIDCWDGSSLAVSAEVKQTTISSTRIADFGAFANEINRRGALGMVVVLDFANDGVRDAIEDLGVRALSRYDLLRIVQLWDPIKQRSAVSALMYYVEHVERNSALSSRLKGFLDEQMASR